MIIQLFFMLYKIQLGREEIDVVKTYLVHSMNDLLTIGQVNVFKNFREGNFSLDNQDSHDRLVLIKKFS